MTTATNPTSVDAHRGSKASYICVVNNGKTAPKILRATVFAARADAATNKYESII